jgi:hypothetical protein
VKSIPTMRLEDSRPARARASVTCKDNKDSFYFKISETGKKTRAHFMENA